MGRRTVGGQSASMPASTVEAVSSGSTPEIICTSISAEKAISLYGSDHMEATLMFIYGSR
jgi:hypothetical protein